MYKISKCSCLFSPNPQCNHTLCIMTFTHCECPACSCILHSSPPLLNDDSHHSKVERHPHEVDCGLRLVLTVGLGSELICRHFSLICLHLRRYKIYVTKIAPSLSATYISAMCSSTVIMVQRKL